MTNLTWYLIWSARTSTGYTAKGQLEVCETRQLANVNLDERIRKLLEIKDPSPSQFLSADSATTLHLHEVVNPDTQSIRRMLTD